MVGRTKAGEPIDRPLRDTEGSGHLFIVQGDLTNLVCDAWLLPTDRQKHIEKNPWRDHLNKHWEAAEVDEAIAGADFDVSPSQPLKGFDCDGRCTPWLTAVAEYADSTESDARRGVESFIRGVVEKADSRDSRLCLAMPVVGTGEGGWNEDAGQLLLELTETILDEIEQDGSPDVILVVYRSEEMFAAAQLARDTALKNRRSAGWPTLSDGLRELALDLADKALHDELVVFVGAGLSQSAGLPGWAGLLNELAKDAGIEVGEDFESMSPLDRAWLIERTLDESGDGKKLGDLVSDKFPENRPPALSHQLVVSLPVREFVTTNYDLLFENASDAAGVETHSIASSAPKRGSRWLLKLHGSADEPGSIVLSRNDYLNYANRRAALAGIVQAMLLTRHMLFVGFSLSDDNFLKIAHDVQNAIGQRPADSNSVGTALMFEPAESLARLWARFIDIKSVDAKKSDGRGLEIFLDLVVSKAVTDRMAFLMDPTFDALLSEDDRKTHIALDEAERSIGEANGSEAASLFRRFLADLGRRESSRSGSNVIDE